MAKRSKRYLKGILSVFAVAVMAVVFMATSASAQDYPSGMVSYWKFDEGGGTIAYDSVNANHGTLINGPVWTTGQVDGALSFDGVDDYVEVPDSANLRPTDAITLEAWVKPMANPGGWWSAGCWGKIIERDYSGNTKPYVSWSLGWWTNLTSPPVREPNLWWFQISTTQDPLEPKLISSTTKVEFGKWYHLVGTYDGTQMMVYVNGKVENSMPITGSLLNEMNKLVTIGTSRFLTAHELFNGLIDEVAIYNRALTPEEIWQHYQSGLQGLGYEVPANNPPVVDAGPNITIDSIEIPYTKIYGTASDPDGDLLTYRWLVDAQGTEQVSLEGNATLDLANLLREGDHDAILEVSDGTYTVTDSMILTVNNSAPVVVPQVSGTYKIGEDIILRADVADFDGDTLKYKWYEGNITYDAGSIETYLGGEPVALVPFAISGGLTLGHHTIILEVEDGHNPAVIKRAEIKVIDTEAPTLAPTVEPSILWPPNHQMVPVEIYANAQDNSGFVTLSASVTSSEPPDTDANGNIIPDYTEPQINQTSGEITLELRAARKGKGVGRTYTITIVAADESNNISQATVEVVAPHDRGN